ncbi:hypothetical protein H632_c1265p0, partial [Helicosporidium sp. ATCC 50920]
SYSVLNITGWSSYPDCWLFPQPAITLVSTDPAQTWQVAFTAGSDDKSAGKDVADAWRWGLDNAGEFRQSDFSANSVVRSLSIGSGETCQGTPGACTAFKWIECLRGNSKPGCSRMLDNDGPTNQGFGNVGTSNVGNFNNGSANVGDFNLGSANVGSFNLGSAVVGNYQSCSACTSPDLQHL